MTGEQRRLVRVLLERAWPQVQLRGTIDYFGLPDDSTEGVRAMSEGLDSLAREVGFAPPALEPYTPPRPI